MTGVCQCGCGRPTKIKRRGEHYHWAPGHNPVPQKPLRHLSSAGYVWTADPTGRRLDNGQGRVRVYEHIAIATRVLGHALPEGAEVHHVDRDKTNNNPSNLVICQDHAYHNLIEKRTRAFRASGHADWRKCCYCKQWDDPKNMLIYAKSTSARHAVCSAIYAKALKARAR